LDAPSARIHREIVQLIVLIVAAVAAFFVTRAVAASNREMNVRDAAEWYARGQRALADGNLEDAIAAFRRSTVRNRTEKTYSVALAGALAKNHDDEAARGVLMALRDADPEDAEVNLELGRIAAARHDVTEALRFYHNALYAPWSPDQTDVRRGVRLELVRFLLAHNQRTRAVSELMALTSDVPDRAAAHAELGTLLAQAGDDAHALDQFQRALQAEGTRADRALVALTDDPLSRRIPAAERRRRVAAQLEYVRGRLAACGRDAALEEEIQAFADQSKHTPLDQDAIEAGVELVGRGAQRVVDTCPNPAPADRALVIVGRMHGSS
jgi:tetratricopeptide (TPR) repeat protein